MFRGELRLGKKCCNFVRLGIPLSHGPPNALLHGYCGRFLPWREFALMAIVPRSSQNDRAVYQVPQRPC